MRESASERIERVSDDAEKLLTTAAEQLSKQAQQGLLRVDKFLHRQPWTGMKRMQELLDLPVQLSARVLARQSRLSKAIVDASASPLRTLARKRLFDRLVEDADADPLDSDEQLRRVRLMWDFQMDEAPFGESVDARDYLDLVLADDVKLHVTSGDPVLAGTYAGKQNVIDFFVDIAVLFGGALETTQERLERFGSFYFLAHRLSTKLPDVGEVEWEMCLVARVSSDVIAEIWIISASVDDPIARRALRDIGTS